MEALARYVLILGVVVCGGRRVSGFGPGMITSTARTERLRRQAVTTPAHPCNDLLPVGGCRGLTMRGSCPFTTAPAAALGQSCTTLAAAAEKRRRRLPGCVNRRNRAVLMLSSSSSSAENRAGASKAREIPPSSSAGLVPQVSDDLPVNDMADDPTVEEVMTVCKAADERKAENIVAIRVAQLTAVTEYMVILEGNSRPQNQAIVQNIEDKMLEIHDREPRCQGAPESGWMLLDFGDIIVHIMTPKSRSYYDLDSFWGNGTPVPLDGVLTPNMPPSEEPVSEEVDPFWS